MTSEREQHCGGGYERGWCLHAARLASSRQRLSFLTSPCAALGLGGLAHFLPSHSRRCLTNHQSVASLAIVLGKSLECPASQLVGFSVHRGGGWGGRLDFIKHDRGTGLMVTLELSGAGSGFLLTQGLHRDLSSAAALGWIPHSRPSLPVLGRASFLLSQVTLGQDQKAWPADLPGDSAEVMTQEEISVQQAHRASAVSHPHSHPAARKRSL